MAVDHPQVRVAATEEVVQFAGGRVQAIEIAQAVGARAAHAAGLDFGKRIAIEELEGFLQSPDAPRNLTAVIHLGACSDTMELDEAVHERLNVAYTKNKDSSALSMSSSAPVTPGANQTGAVVGIRHRF